MQIRIRLLTALSICAFATLSPPAVLGQSRTAEKYQASATIKDAQSRIDSLSQSEINRLFATTRSWAKRKDMVVERQKLLKIICKTKFANANNFCDLAETYSSYLAEASEQNSAEQCYREAVKRDPNHSFAWARLAELRMADGFPAEALEYSNKALACKEPYDEAYLQNAQILAAMKRYDEALVRIKQGEKAGENFGEFFRCKGSILENLGRYEEALQAYQRSFKFQKKDWTTFRMASCLEKLKRYPEAIAELDKLLILNPADSEARRTRAALKIEAKDLKGALVDLSKALDEEPTVKGYEDRAHVFELMGKKELAKQDRERIKRLKDSPY